MHLAVVACGNRLDETLTMVKSALLFSLKRITFHIFAEDPLAPQFEERVRSDAKMYAVQIFTERHKIKCGPWKPLHSFWFIFYVHFFSESSDL